MPRDLLAEPKDLLQAQESGMPFQNAPSPWDFAQGVGQSLQNFGIGAYNLLPGQDIPKADWAPETGAARAGEFAGEIGSYFLPGTAFLKGAKLLKGAPLVGNWLTRPLGMAAESALMGGIQSDPGEDKIKNMLLAGLTGGGFGGASEGIKILRNPLARGAVLGSLGATYGGIEGGWPGALSGLGAGITLGSMQKAKRGLEVLDQPLPEQIGKAKRALQAGQRIGAPPSPSEAFKNSYMAGIEAGYGRGENAAIRTKYHMQRVKQQENAINNLLDTIFDKSQKSKNQIRNLYKEAYKTTISPNALNSFRKDEIISEAFDKVQSKPALRKGLRGVPENNVAYLDQVKRAMDDMQSKALKAGEKNEARIIGETKDKFVKFLDKRSPGYEEARMEAQRSIIRSQIQKQMRKKELRGTDFYDAFFKNKEEGEKLIQSLKNVPDAQRQLRDMRRSWENLTNLVGNVKAEHGATVRGMSDFRNSVKDFKEKIVQLFGARKVKEAHEFFYGGKWDKGFDKIQQIKDKKARNDAINNMVMRGLSFTTIGQIND